VAGAGWVAETIHLPFLRDTHLARLTVVVDPDSDRLKRVCDAFDVPGARTLDALAPESIDAVLIATPPATHEVMIERSLQRGWHVVCEKPLVTRVASVRRLAALAECSELSMRTCHTARFRRDVKVLRDHMRSGHIGSIRHIRLSWLRGCGIPATPGGRQAGVIWDLGSHLVDLLWHLCPLPAPRRIRAAGVSIGDMRSDRATAAWQTTEPSDPVAPVGRSTPASATIALEFGRLSAHVEVAWATGVEPDRTEVIVVGDTGHAALRSVFGNSPARATAAPPCLTVARWDEPPVIVTGHGTAAAEYRAQDAQLFTNLEAGCCWPPPSETENVIAVLEEADKQARSQ
jgi:predicted dehydrogenase